MIGSPSDTTNKIFMGTGIILILLSLCATWSIPYGSGDLYISLAAGHDVLAGKLGAPDDWSFSTDGKVWMNQNWGADVILYLVQTAFGDTGLLTIKFLLLALSALFLFLALHERKIEPAVSFVVTSVVIVLINMYAVLRPNLFSLPLCALELWLLFKSTKRPSCLWIAVLVTLFWANVHAGFILGLGMLCLWAICRIAPELWRKKLGAFRQNWQMLAAVAAAFVLAGLVNPFGFNNLIHPFTMMQGSEWNTTLDWLPIWDKSLSATHMSSIIGYLGIVCATLLLLGLRLLMLSGRKAKPKSRDQGRVHGRALEKIHDEKSVRPGMIKGRKLPGKEGSSKAPDTDTSGITDSEGDDERQGDFPSRIVIFEALLALVTLAMAVLSNRFIILALVALAPLLARQLAWLCRIVKFYRLILVVVSGFVLVFGMLILYDNAMSYDPHNPVMNNGTGSLFEKMHFTNKLYDKELIRFMNTNRIGGHVYCPWTWEGYLRLNSPQLKPFIGGRAQQIYSIDDYNRYMYTSGYDIPAYRGKAPTEVLNAIDAHYLIAANSQDSQNLVLTALNCGNWVIVYADAQWLLFANNRAQNAAAIINLSEDDKLIFEKEVTRAMSKAAHLLSQVSGLQMESLLPLFKEAWKYEPGWLWSYWILYNNLGFDADFLRELVLLMKEQLSRLEKMSLEGADADTILRCRIYLSSALEEYARNRDIPTMAATQKRSLETASRLEVALYKKWKTITR